MIPTFTGFTDRAKRTQALVDAKQFATAMDALNAEGNAFVQADVENMAQMNDSTVTTFNATTGAFTVTSSDGFVAGRTAYAAPVEAS